MGIRESPPALFEFGQAFFKPLLAIVKAFFFAQNRVIYVTADTWWCKPSKV